ncbi:RNA-directed DNA polymerase, eukaryota, reverse transcriptase zinc-binding domain protein [Tanacetum coccineum]
MCKTTYECSKLLNATHDSIPFFYLGLSVGKKMNSCNGWSAVINRFRDKLTSWKSNSLSIGGGLGVGSLLSKNIGLLCKWKWRFLVEKNALWQIVIKEFYGEDGGFGSTSSSLGVSNGQNTRFWLDPWCASGLRLSDMFPRLYALDRFKDCKISDRWSLSNSVWGGNWDWRLPLRGRANDDLSAMLNIIGNLELISSTPDKWEWACEKSGMFKTKTLCKYIQDSIFYDEANSNPHKWNPWIPKKVNICVWRAACDRLPTLVNLNRRGVTLPSSLCPFCHNEVEGIEHSIIRCPRVCQVWRKLWAWWNLDFPVGFPSFTIGDLVSGSIISHVSQELRKSCMVSSAVRFDVFGNGETRLYMRIKVKSLKSLMKTCSLPFKESQRDGSRPGSRLMTPIGPVGFNVLGTFFLVFSF